MPKRITGHLEEKNGKWYAAVNHYDAEGKRKVKWHSLDLEAKKGTKKEAEARLNKLLDKFNTGDLYLQEAMTHAERERNRLANTLVEDYLPEWLEGHRGNITASTYKSYKAYIENRIAPFFHELHLTVKDVTGDEINEFYNTLRADGLKGTSCQRYHALLHEAFKHAMKRRIIPTNPVEQADRPKSQQFIGSYYNAEEIKNLLKITEDDELHLIIALTSHYGLRRSEVLGLKWSAIDFDTKMIFIRHKVLSEEDGPRGYDVMKTKSSYRSAPLSPFIEGLLRKEKEKQEEMKRVMRGGYCHDYDDYVNVDVIGRLYDPDYVSSHFDVVLKKHGLRKIRFHDLRHSCASILVANGVPMKMVQEFMGHSDMATTANIYSHIDAQSKLATAAVITSALAMDDE